MEVGGGGGGGGGGNCSAQLMISLHGYVPPLRAWFLSRLGQEKGIHFALVIKKSVRFSQRMIINVFYN